MSSGITEVRGSNAAGHWMLVTRRARGLAQDALADAADLDPTYIRKIEMGKKTPSRQALTRVATALAPENADAKTVRAILHAGLCAAGLAPLQAGGLPTDALRESP